MEPVLLDHSRATSGLLAWQGIIALATLVAGDSKARQSHSSNDSPGMSTTSQQQSMEADASASSPRPCAVNPSFWACVPHVMAYLSLHTEQDEQHLEPVADISNQRQPQQKSEQLQQILKLLQADPTLTGPYIYALVTHCQHGQSQAAPDALDTKQRLASDGQIPAPMASASALPASGSAVPPQGTLGTASAATVEQSEGCSVYGKYQVVSAVEAILRMSEQPGLHAHLLTLQQQLFQACRDLRCVPATALIFKFAVNA